MLHDRFERKTTELYSDLDQGYDRDYEIMQAEISQELLSDADDYANSDEEDWFY